MEIRKAKISDLEQLIKFRDNIPQLSEFNINISAFYEYMIKKGIAIVCIENEKIIGMMLGEIDEDTKSSYIFDCAVKKDKRLVGIGNEMYSLYLADCRKNGMKFVSAHVLESNKKAVEIFKKVGFTIGRKYYFIYKKID